ncbi:NADH-quinone oxidoreductase subunit L [bacterium]|nr:NADH-quinone oxidoreductase subunit L [bacterium]MBU1434778.1 NADH-quinone oxidoreductase subunit L [bacterium]MBU1502766.1 NADH-quinone oxidoreductase subunit L [bacterium]
MTFDDQFTTLTYALLALPFLSALILLLSFKFLGKAAYKISIFFSLLTLLGALSLGYLFYENSLSEKLLFANTLYTLNISSLTIVMSIFVSLVGLVVHKFSIKYMYDEEGYIRFFILLDMMIGIILSLLFAGNIIVILAFWHLIGLNLYFILVHNYKREKTYKYGFYTYFTHLLADIPLFFAIYLIFDYYKTLDLHTFLNAINTMEVQNISVLWFDVSSLQVIGLLIMLAALIKSTQFPFHIWLAYTLEGPNPASALMHAGIVNAGAFLINRFAPLFVHADFALHLAFFVGFITAVIGSALMLVQNDVKKSLAYSTIGQMGYMMLEIGVGAFALAVYHLIVHGLFKATLFLGSGDVIHNARKAPNISGKSYFNFFFNEEDTDRTPWFIHAILTTVAPMAIVVGIYVWLSGGLMHFQGDVILLFFAWLTGAQAIFSVYRSVLSKMWVMLFLTTLLFSVAIVAYLSIEHWFGGIIYTNQELSSAIFASAAIPELLFYAIVSIALFLVIVGWIFAFYSEEKRKIKINELTGFYHFIYKTLSREFYILDMISLVSFKLKSLSLRLNTKFKY